MRWTISAAIMMAAAPAAAGTVAIDSAVYLGTSTNGGGLTVAPAGPLRHGDRVITILRWDAPRTVRFTAVSAVPAAITIESASRTGIEVSLDDGRSWHKLADFDAVPAGITHLRWQIAGEDRLSYRAVVR